MTAFTLTTESGVWTDFSSEDIEKNTVIETQLVEETFYLKIEELKGERLITRLLERPRTKEQILSIEKDNTRLQVFFAFNLLLLSVSALKLSHYAVIMVILSSALLFRRLAHITTILVIKRQ